MITLFGNLESGNVYKVQLIFSHLDVLHRRVDVSQTRGEPVTAAYRALNPVGKVPAVLFDDGCVLSESGAILYRFAVGTPYWPADLESQAEVLRWMFFEQYSHEPAIAVNRYLLNYTEDPAAHAETIARNRPKGLHALAVMEERLLRAGWLVADRYSIADMALFAYSHTADQAGFELRDFPAIRAWIRRVEEQPGFLPMLMDDAVENPAFSDYFPHA